MVLDPKTGQILALANVPTFSPNKPGDARDRKWRQRIRNRAITDPYEPGSTFKAMLAAAAIETGVKLSGCTVHFADDHYDTGPIILQAAVPVLDDDTAESLAARVHEQENLLYPQAIRLFAEGRLRIEGRRVRILP